MKVSLLQENFAKTLSKTQRVIGGKPQLPILSHVLLTAKEGKLFCAATNLETTIIAQASAKVSQEGSLCVPARLLFDLVASLEKDTAELTVEKDQLSLVCARAKAKIPGVSAGEFPPVPSVHENTGVDVEKEKLFGALSVVVFAAAQDDSRPLLSGVNIKQTEKETIFAATDGYRLCIKTLTEKGIVQQEMTIPARALSEVIKIGSDEKEEKTIRMAETIDGQIVFSTASAQIFTRRIDGEYPKVEGRIPTGFATRIVVSSQELAQAVKSASIFAKDSSGVIKLATNEEGLSVSANTPQVGENVIDVEAEVEGEEGVVAINNRFLLDFFSHFSEKDVVIDLNGALSPVLFSAPNDETFKHIIMPVRVND